MRRTFAGISAVLLLASSVAAYRPALRAQQGAPLFSAHADLVVLHVAVTDRSGRYVAGLPRDAFTVYEDNAPQPIELFSTEDTPATIGLLIDDSASMFGMRDLVTAGAAAFAATSNRADEIFALAFNEHVHTALPAGLTFTSDPDVLRYYLQHAIAARGRTALYDAVASGLDYLGRGVHPRKALVILSDGGDNASTLTLEAMVQAAAESNTVIYGIAMLDPTGREGKPDLLKRLAQASGGIAYTPRNPHDLAEVLTRVARDIRSSYSIAYAPPAGTPGARHVRVMVRDAGGNTLRARTRTEYVAK